MKQKFEMPLVLVIAINEEDIIKTSNFGNSLPGDTEQSWEDFWNAQNQH